MIQSTRFRDRVSFRSGLLVALTVVAVTALGACSLYGFEPPRKPEVGQAVLTITAVPEDVKCLRITAAGPGRSEERELDVGAGAATMGEMAETLTGLPLGTVVFRGEAFSGACSAVSKTTVAAWTSEPVTTSVVIGRLASVTLVMSRNGRARVGVDWKEEAACSATGEACRQASECCNKRCTAGVCAASSDASSD
jgi:hypothetical protein